MAAVVLLTLFALAAGMNLPLGPGQDCTEEGKSWSWDCNTCTCVSGQAACTMKACPPKSEAAIGPGEECKNEGESWPWECNTCTCSSGIATCTQKACERKKRDTGNVVLGPGEPYANEGESWKWECNQCFCTSGMSACTQKACLRRKRESDKTCTPRTVWTRNCQSCRCDADGMTHCEAVPDCIPSDAPEKTTCKPGEEWMRDCNRCKCNDDGVAACSRKLCMSDPHFEVSLPGGGERRKRDTSGGSCTPQTVWTKNCQKCKCDSEGVAHCETVPDCVPSNTTPKTTCEPGETWKDECNNCHCTETGIPACTKKLCISSPHYEVALPPSEERKKRDLSEDKIEKTDVDCLTGQNFWGKGCEWCTCYDGGNATCVIDKDCLKKEEEKANIKQEVQQEQTEKREKRSPAGPPPNCAPGQTYKDDCNTCTCVENGPPFCTLKLCVSQGNVGTFTFKPTAA